MKNSLKRLASSTGFIGAAALALILYAAVRNVLAAASTPFGYDEILTVIVSRMAGLSAVWNALSRGVDGQPPLYYMTERVAALLGPRAEIAYRLPSILGLCIALWCVFVLIRRRDGPSAALIFSSALLLTPLSTEHAASARPYDLVVACIAVALVCYQHAGKRVWAATIAVSLVTAGALHYYAVFAFVPFAVAETVRTARERVLRKPVWIALACGALPLAVCWPLLQVMKRTYGPHVWDPPSLDTAIRAYGGHAIAAVVLLLALAMAGTFTWGAVNNRAADDDSYQDLIVAVLLTLPLLGLLATKVTHAGYSGRYFLPTVLGVPLAGAYAFRRTGRRGIVLILAGAILLAAIARKEAAFWRGQRGHLGKLVTPAESIAPMVTAADHEDLPLVVSDGLDYLPLAYYASPALAKRIVAVVDEPKSIVYARSDGIDRGLTALASFYPVGVYQFGTFAPEHPQFLLYSNGSDVWDWWPRRLADDGYSLQTVASDGVRRIYLVGPGAPPTRK